MDGGVLGPGQWVSVLLNLNREMDDAVVGETEEDDDEDCPALCADTFQDSLRTVRSLVDTAHSGSSGRTRFALLEDALWRALVLPLHSPTRELRRRVLAAGSRGREGAPVQVRQDRRPPGVGPLPSPRRRRPRPPREVQLPVRRLPKTTWGRRPTRTWLYDVNGVDRMAVPSRIEGTGGPLGQRCVSTCSPSLSLT